LGEALNCGASSAARLFLGSKAKVAPGFLFKATNVRGCSIDRKNGRSKSGGRASAICNYLIGRQSWVASASEQHVSVAAPGKVVDAVTERECEIAVSVVTRVFTWG